MIKLNLTCKVYFLAVVLSFPVFSANAANRYSVSNGNWNSNATWSATSGGAPGASFPVAGDVVFIENGNNITVTANATCASITFPNQATNPTLTVNATFTLTVSGTFTVMEFEGAVDGAVAISGGGSLVCTNVTLGESPYNPGARLTATQSINSTIGSFNISGNLNLLSPYKAPNRYRNAVFNIASGIVTVGGSVISTNENVGNISTLSLATGAQTGTLILSGATPFSLSATGTNTITLNGTSALVNYNRAGAQTVYATTYTNLTLSGSGAKTVTGVIVNGILSMESTATAAGTSPFYGAASTLQYKGTGSQTTGTELAAILNNLIINNAAGVTQTSSVAAGGTLTLTSGALSIGANTLTLSNGSNLSYGGGSLTGGATSNLTIGTGADITLNSISGGLNNFNTDRNITLGADLSVNGTLTLTAGTFTVGANTLTLNGPNTAGTPTNLATTSASSLTFGGSSAGVLIPGSVTALNNLTINNANGVTIQAPLNITRIVSVQNGNLSSGGNLTLLSTAAQTALIDGSGAGSVTGNVTMQRYLASGFGYKYFSSAFQASTVSEFGDDMNLAAPFPSFYRYDESRTSSGWVSYINPAGVLNPMQGYTVNFGSSGAPNTADVTGIVNNGNMSLTLYNNNNAYTKGFNLVGNPYPSPIDWDEPSGWTKANIDDALYYFKASGTDQYGGTYSTYVNGVSSDGLATGIIPSMQGFFVHVSDGTWPVTGTLGSTNSVRVTDLTHGFLKSVNSDLSPLLRLSVFFEDAATADDPLVIYFDPKATKGFDSMLDALKLMNTDLKVPNIYAITPDGRKLSINALRDSSDFNDDIPLGIKLNRNGKIIFRIKDNFPGLPVDGVFLSDMATGIETNLADKEYSVSLTTGEYLNRFYLHSKSVITDISQPDGNGNMVRIYTSPGKINVDITSLPGGKSNLRILSLTGQVVFVTKFYATGHYEFYPDLNTGIYVALFDSGKERRSIKILFTDR